MGGRTLAECPQLVLAINWRANVDMAALPELGEAGAYPLPQEHDGLFVGVSPFALGQAVAISMLVSGPPPPRP